MNPDCQFDLLLRAVIRHQYPQLTDPEIREVAEVAEEAAYQTAMKLLADRTGATGWPQSLP